MGDNGQSFLDSVSCYNEDIRILGYTKVINQNKGGDFMGKVFYMLYLSWRSEEVLTKLVQRRSDEELLFDNSI